MITKATVKPWGSSLAIIIPREVVREVQLKTGSEVIIDINKKVDLSDIFGSLKDWKIDSQKMKDEARKDWAK